ncbi:MAG: hypothetical protein F6K28_47760, partial [Microcoleus sp. SIO2G3]|nr:hypothetical protein [Microcoleus sp. SIO2G3]
MELMRPGDRSAWLDRLGKDRWCKRNDRSCLWFTAPQGTQIVASLNASILGQVKECSRSPVI